ncbi:hypothetical protein GCM10009609_23340 [Pseudonocardia aurantiaca]|uniref:Uncharacterized protein n=1 Tax=Pseudonocardia aurantiaca TaxID=75290 RepID=A0ABW4FFC4_9PSEU
MGWTLDELREAVQKPVGDPTPARPVMTVRSIHDDGDHLVVVLDAGRPGAEAERWELSFATTEGDLTRMPLDHAALILRANLEEWWDTRDQYPAGVPGVVEKRVGTPSQ